LILVDTSVLIPYYVPEPTSDKVEAALSKTDVMSISALIEVEFHSVIARKMRESLLTRSYANRILARFNADLKNDKYGRLSIGIVQYNTACDFLLRCKTPLRSLDALHLATTTTNDLKLITADRRLFEAATALNVDAIFL
jgi:predicted nucleic acid-binding protein